MHAFEQHIHFHNQKKIKFPSQTLILTRALKT